MLVTELLRGRKLLHYPRHWIGLLSILVGPHILSSFIISYLKNDNFKVTFKCKNRMQLNYDYGLHCEINV